jgi:Tol biopolymer transport system component
VLWVVSASRSERRQLTHEPQQMYGLTWSADSRSLIFAGGPVRNFHLFQVSIDGGAIKPLTTGVGDYSSPSISPDGKTLVFCHANRTSDVSLANGLNNPEVESATRGQYHLWPRLRPCATDQSVASVLQRPDFNEYLYLTDFKTGKSVRLSDRVAHHPSWMGEDHVAYLSFDAAAQKTEVRVVNRGTGVNSAWTQFPGEAKWLAVHPDRKRLAVVLTSVEGRQKLVLRELEPQTDLTLAEGAEYEALRWAPDGSLLSWSGPRVSGGATSNGIWVIEPGQGQPRQLVPDGYGPTWSADGASLYFFKFPPSLWRLDVRHNVLTKVRDLGWGVQYYDLVKERLVFTEFSNSNQIYSVPLDR